MTVKHWDMRVCDTETAHAVAEENDITVLQAALLHSRDITQPEDIAAFFDCVGEDAIEEPFALVDMDRAVERIELALEKGENICVFGDYDVDGICSTIMLYEFLTSLGGKVSWRLPSREGDGYGFSRNVAEELFTQGVNLVITVDNGIAAAEEIELAKKLGMEVLVTDHHMPPPAIPDCIVVDPHRADCNSGFKDLCGAGVVFKLIWAMCEDTDEAFSRFGDLLTLATIADIVPILQDNRAIVKRGLRLIEKTSRPGLRALISVAGLRAPINTYSVSFGLAPRLNAAGRIGNAEDSARLLMERDSVKAAELAERINGYNAQRHEIEQRIMQQAEQRYFSDNRLRCGAVIIVAAEGWETGVAGIVAAKMVEKYGKPCAVLGIKDGVATGSARAPEGFSLFETFGKCRELFDKFGGHDAAVGMTLAADKLPLLFDKINAVADSAGRIEPPSLHVDGYLKPAQFILGLAEEIESLEPFGCGNRQPLFRVNNLVIRNIRGTKSGEHCMLELAKGRDSFCPMLFGVGPDKLGFSCGENVDVLVTVSTKEYNGSRELSVIVKDIRRSGFDEEKYFAATYGTEAAARGGKAPEVSINRSEIADVYRYYKLHGVAADGIELEYAFGDAMDFRKVMLATEILTQLGLVTRGPGEVKFIGSDTKLELDSSPLYAVSKEQ